MTDQSVPPLDTSEHARASQYRPGRFELSTFAQGPNSFMVVVGDREAPMSKVQGGGVAVSSVQLELPETMFTSEEMEHFQVWLGILEAKCAAKHAEHAEAPEDLNANINAAAQAKKDLASTNAAIEAAQLAAQAHELEQIAKRAEADNELAAKKAEADQLEAKLIEMRAAAAQTEEAARIAAANAEMTTTE